MTSLSTNFYLQSLYFFFASHTLLCDSAPSIITHNLDCLPLLSSFNLSFFKFSSPFFSFFPLFFPLFSFFSCFLFFFISSRGEDQISAKSISQCFANISKLAFQLTSLSVNFEKYSLFFFNFAVILRCFHFWLDNIKSCYEAIKTFPLLSNCFLGFQLSISKPRLNSTHSKEEDFIICLKDLFSFLEVNPYLTSAVVQIGMYAFASMVQILL